MEAVSLAPKVIFNLGSFAVTSTFILQIFVYLLILVTLLALAHYGKKRPGKFQLIIESILEFIYKQVDQATMSRQKTEMIFPLIFAIFIFIFTSNLFTMLPGLGAFSIIALDESKVSLFRSVLADYSAVLALTVVTITLAQLAFILTQGWAKYLKQFFDFSNPINFFLGLMNVVGEAAKVLSLSFRLFGNVFGGEVLLSIVTALVPLVVPVPFFILGLFSAVIQAYVFAILSTIFISSNLALAEKS